MATNTRNANPFEGELSNIFDTMTVHKKVMDELLASPQGIPENVLFQHWHGQLTRDQYDTIIQAGVDQGVLSTTNGSDNTYVLTPQARSKMQQMLAQRANPSKALPSS